MSLELESVDLQQPGRTRRDDAVLAICAGAGASGREVAGAARGPAAPSGWGCQAPAYVASRSAHGPLSRFRGLPGDPGRLQRDVSRASVGRPLRTALAEPGLAAPHWPCHAAHEPPARRRQASVASRNSKSAFWIMAAASASWVPVYGPRGLRLCRHHPIRNSRLCSRKAAGRAARAERPLRTAVPGERAIPLLAHPGGQKVRLVCPRPRRALPSAHRVITVTAMSRSGECRRCSAGLAGYGSRAPRQPDRVRSRRRRPVG
jgi:hypothetical protein